MLKENGGFPKNWRDLLNHTAFSNTGYNGLVQAPTILSAEGDLVLGFTACVYNGTMFACNNFGKTNDAGFSYYMKPQFFGGSYIPPPDGPPIQEITYFSETIETQHGQIIVILISLGLIVCLLCLKFLVENRRKSVVRAKIFTHSVSIVLGIMIIYASLALYLNEATVVTCNLRIWMLAFGCSLCLAAFIFKNIFISQVISARKKLKREYIQHLELSRELCLTATVLIENIIVIIYALKGGSVPSYAPVGLNSINVCKSTSSSEHWETAIYAYNIALAVALLPTVYFVRNMQSIHNEFILLGTIFVLLAIFFGFVRILDSNPTRSSTFYRAICIWFSATVILVLFLGPVMYKMHRDTFLDTIQKRILNNMSNQKQKSNMTTSRGFSKSVSIMSPKLGVRSQLGSPGSYHRRDHDLKCVIFRWKMSHTFFWSTWTAGKITFNCTASRMWIALEQIMDFQCFGLENIQVTKKENYARLEFRNIVVEVVGLDGTNVGDEVMAKFQEMKQTFQRRIAAALEKSDTEAVLKKVFSHEILSNGGVNGAMSNDEQ
ncbi:hypothetical protein BCR33DRAFT_251516 [Rhizoclosmatium globosum]|uniref:G-protein coupled receptors family 3 profile domain-containing protein n=1 Tax=Rhizoclosmatium globosum TaxID=329046 RepID=A0A1Y2CAH7_9FUNG|nr:hypothetical protein BCR33DRAFT_251516 [Rhizoclosmatium globosum]|eukprot:ORY43864.1 hypothetical protein BCR33DRAFT_251516 [Rhizoclosmatium globosum]